MGSVKLLYAMDQNCPNSCENYQDGKYSGTGRQQRDAAVFGKALTPNSSARLTNNLGSKNKVQSVLGGLTTCGGAYDGYYTLTGYGVN